jgi:hypothetical protein
MVTPLSRSTSHTPINRIWLLYCLIPVHLLDKDGPEMGCLQAQYPECTIRPPRYCLTVSSTPRRMLLSRPAELMLFVCSGSVLVAGSNPNSDFNDTATYPTEYRVEIFYPLYYNERRPQPQGLPSSFTYGGAYFNVSLSKDDLFDNVQNAKNTSVVIIRTGFSTHAMVNDFMRFASD